MRKHERIVPECRAPPTVFVFIFERDYGGITVRKHFNAAQNILGSFQLHCMLSPSRPGISKSRHNSPKETLSAMSLRSRLYYSASVCHWGVHHVKLDLLVQLFVPWCHICAHYLSYFRQSTLLPLCYWPLRGVSAYLTYTATLRKLFTGQPTTGDRRDCSLAARGRTEKGHQYWLCRI